MKSCLPGTEAQPDYCYSKVKPRSSKMSDDESLEPVPEHEEQTSINDFLPPGEAPTPIEIREPTDQEIAAFFESQGK